MSREGTSGPPASGSGRLDEVIPPAVDGVAGWRDLAPAAGGHTVGDALKAGNQALRGIAESPWLEAEILLGHLTAVARATLLAHPERRLAVAHVRQYRELVRRRASGTPLPYLTGRATFYNLDLAVTPDVLIPRPETETLVDLALRAQPKTIVDVGTGSGCIAIALTTQLPRARAVATDRSKAALRVAAANARSYCVHDRVHFVHCDLARPLRGPVDLLVSNPPYIAEAEWPTLPRSVRDHEPRLALDGGADGLAVVRRILAVARRVVAPGGTVLIEIGATQGQGALAAAQTRYPAAEVTLHPDLAGRDRVVEVRMR